MGGLRPLFEDLARRLATHGLAVVAFEQFALQPETSRASAEARMGAVKDLDDDQQLEMFSAAADLMVVDDDVAKVSMIGFCMGGHYTFKAASTDRFDAAVAFYGMLRTPDGWGGAGHRIEPLAAAAQMVPTLAFFGTADPWTPTDDIAALRTAWASRNDCEIVIVEGAEHGFVHDPDRPIHRADDAAMAWEKSLAWIS
jgi:carboxymethylenebutenolidase